MEKFYQEHSIEMKSFRTINPSVLFSVAVLFILLAIVSWILDKNEREFINDNQVIKERVHYYFYDDSEQNKYKTRLRKFTGETIKGVIQGFLFGMIVSGRDGAITGSLVFGIVNPVMMYVDEIFM